MSNRVTIIPTSFVDVRSGEITHGFRMFDNYSNAYCNLMDYVPDDDLVLLQEAVLHANFNQSMRDMLDWVIEEAASIESR